MRLPIKTVWIPRSGMHLLPEKMVYDLLGSEQHLRSKRDLIEKFIERHMPNTQEGQTIEEAFTGFWAQEKSNSIAEICETERIRSGCIQKHD